MKWVLLWTAVTAQGGITSGSAEFSNIEACYAAQKTLGSTMGEASMAFSVRSSTESYCLNQDTGERKTTIQPRR